MSVQINSGWTGAPIDGVPEVQVLRAVMAQVASPVSIVTTTAHGRPHGATVSAFTSLSFEPPMLLVSLKRESQLLAAILSSGRFGVNVLADTQVDLAVIFSSRRGAAKFEEVAWESAAGLPRLTESTAWVACRTVATIEGGDHIVLFGSIEQAEPGAGRPLVYHDRVFGTHSACPVAGGTRA
jgi:flavin reductase (DIM6/NTAB) family NADH-FMN oxidoreductase RutF